MKVEMSITTSVITFALALSGTIDARNAPARPQQTTAPGALQLESVTVNGSKRCTNEDVIRLGGLKIGQTITPPALDNAANKLAATGLFASVNYRYTTASGKLTLVVDVQEEPWTLPVVFDNFVWFNDADVMAAVRKDVPSFDGMLPANGEVLTYVAGILERMLADRGVRGRVVGESRVNLASGTKQQLFKVTDTTADLKICALHVAGGTAVSEADVLKAGQSVIGTAYSRAFISDLAKGTLRQEYRRRGYWAAELTPQTAALDQGCTGVAVTLAVKEGAAYTWNRAEWSGVAALPSSDLSTALGMKAGEIVDVTRLDSGLRAVHDVYEKNGYLMQNARYTPALDEATRTATFRIDVAEGAQFHMGTLAFPGVSQDDAARLAKKWKIQAGDVFDGSYPRKFMADEILPLQNSGKLPRNLRPEMVLDAGARLVNVSFVVK
jgi:outer membrane protein assembly factor BamA